MKIPRSSPNSQSTVALVLRWFIKPWLQSALIFSILQMLIAFAYAETQLPQANIGAFFRNISGSASSGPYDPALPLARIFN